MISLFLYPQKRDHLWICSLRWGSTRSPIHPIDAGEIVHSGWASVAGDPRPFLLSGINSYCLLSL
jgi:hypothetical protein